MRLFLPEPKAPKHLFEGWPQTIELFLGCNKDQVDIAALLPRNQYQPVALDRKSVV